MIGIRPGRRGRLLRSFWLIGFVLACPGCNSPGDGNANCPVAGELGYSVFCGAPLSAEIDAPGVTSFRLSTPPKMGEVTTLDESSGAFCYVSDLDVVGSDSFKLETRGANGSSGECTVRIDIEPMNFTELWATRNSSVSVDGADQGACLDGAFDVLHIDTALELADRLHDCEAVNFTHNEIAFTLNDGAISYQETQIGRVGPSSIQYEHCLGSTCFSLEISRVHGQDLFDYHETFSNADLEAESTAQLRPTGARLLAVDGDAYYFREASPFGIPAEQTILLKNTGTSPALNLAGAFDREPFYFKGEAYPGAGGTCQTTLDPGLECSLVVEYQPLGYQMNTADLSIGYENLLGPAELILHLTGTSRTETEILGTAADQRFSLWVAGSGDAVAARADDGLYLYRRSAEGWAEERLFNPGAITAIDLKGDLLIFGYGGADESVDIYRHNGSDWVVEGTLTTSETLDGFGGRVAVSGDHALVALTSIQAVNAYRYDGGSWQFVEQLTGAADSGFGYNLALDETTALISVTAGDDPSVAVYGFNGTSWEPQQTLTVDDATLDSHLESFGQGVGLDGDWAVISGREFARGSRAFIFHREAGTWTLSQVFGSGYTDFSDGNRVAIEGPWMVTAALGSFNDNGHTFILKLVDGQWQTGMQIPTGFAVDAAETFVVTGEPYETVHGIGADVGMVRIYE